MVGILSSLKSVLTQDHAESRAIRFPLGPRSPLAFLPPPRRERSSAELARMIEGEIIPRLMLAHGALEESDRRRSTSSIGPRTLDAFARMTLTSEVHTLTAYVEALIQGGVSLEEVYVDLLIPTARRLGDDWVEDLVSFTDVTIGLAHLQQLVRALGHSVPAKDVDAGAPSAFFVPAPGEQHAFGLVILEDYFRRAGWRTWLDTAATREEAVDTVRREWFDVFGISATADASKELITTAIADVRAASTNPNLFVMVGGRLFIEEPALAVAVGADAASGTAGDALIIADKAIRPHAFA